MKKPWYDFLYVRSPLAKLGFALLGVLGAIAILVWWGAAVEVGPLRSRPRAATLLLSS